MQEKWKEVEFGYYVSNEGRVKTPCNSKQPNKVLKGQCLKGYKHVSLWDGEKYHRRRINRLVAKAFIGDIPSEMQVDHKNGIRSDNRVENLEIVSCRENISRAYARNGRVRDLPLGVQLLKGCISKPYQACIRVKGKFIHLGTFSDKHKAHMAYVNYKNNLK
jgi:hypothetical protein